MRVDEHVAAVEDAGARLASAAEKAGLDVLVPTCPDWEVRDLVAHQGGVYRWAAWHVTTGIDRAATDDEEAALFATPSDDALLDWFAEGHHALVDALRTADPALECWSFLPAPSPLAFWARRQAHETTIHRVDAESAAGIRSPIDARLAADGVDELLFGFLARPYGKLLSDPPCSLSLRAIDTGDAWTMSIESDRRVPRTGFDDRADCRVHGSASEIYQLLWNRPARDLDVHGDESILALWRERALIRWG